MVVSRFDTEFKPESIGLRTLLVCLKARSKPLANYTGNFTIQNPSMRSLWLCVNRIWSLRGTPHIYIV